MPGNGKVVQWGQEMRQFAATLLDEERVARTRRRMWARGAVSRIGRELQRPELKPIERRHLESAQRALRMVAQGNEPKRRKTPPRQERAGAAVKKKRRRRRRRRKAKVTAVA